jgi:hypothetical protein
MKQKIILLFTIILFSSISFADDLSAQSCAGDYLEGKVTTPLSYVSGKKLKNVELSHTKFHISAIDGKDYEVSVDNIFANDYSASTVPYSLKNRLQKGTNVKLCGEKYSDGSGIHWVHTECPKNNNVEGFVIVNGTNLTASKQYCYIFG